MRNELGATCILPLSWGARPSSPFRCRSPRVSRAQMRFKSSRTCTRSLPSLSVSISTRSPPGWRSAPGGRYPWLRTSRGFQGMDGGDPFDAPGESCGDMALVLKFCLSSPFIQRRTGRACGSGISSGGTSQGPRGEKVSGTSSGRKYCCWAAGRGRTRR